MIHVHQIHCAQWVPLFYTKAKPYYGQNDVKNDAHYLSHISTFENI